MRKQIKQPGYQCLFLFLNSTEMKLLQLIQTTTDLMMLMLRDGYFPFKLIWLQLKCVLQPWTGLADISCTYAASSDPPTCTWRAWTVKECEDTAFAWLHYIQNKSADSEVSQGRFFIGRAKWSLLRKKKVGGSHALLQHSDSLAAEHRQMWLIKQKLHKREKLLPLKLELLQVSRISG